MHKVLITLLALATVATAQTVGSSFKLPHQTIATSSAANVKAVHAILARHDMRTPEAWDQETVKLYQSSDILTLNKGTTIVIDKTTGDTVQFHVLGKTKRLYLSADLIVR